MASKSDLPALLADLLALPADLLALLAALLALLTTVLALLAALLALLTVSPESRDQSKTSVCVFDLMLAALLVLLPA